MQFVMRAILSIITSLLVVSEAASVIRHGSNHTDACGSIFQQGLRHSPHEREKLPICPLSPSKFVLNELQQLNLGYLASWRISV